MKYSKLCKIEYDLESKALDGEMSNVVTTQPSQLVRYHGRHILISRMEDTDPCSFVVLEHTSLSMRWCFVMKMSNIKMMMKSRVHYLETSLWENLMRSQCCCLRFFLLLVVLQTRSHRGAAAWNTPRKTGEWVINTYDGLNIE